jgi:isoleucyl-tRNA synthetase
MATLHEVMDVLTRLLAPFVPFVTDYVWQHLHADADSVHLTSWPSTTGLTPDPALVARMRLVRDLVELGRSTRAAHKVRTRQPLARAVVHAPGFAELPDDLRQQIAEELNVRAVEPMTTDLVEVTVKPNFRVLGKRFGPRMRQLAQAIADAGPPVDGALTVVLDGEKITLAGDDLVLAEQPREGWAVTTENGLSVALDLELDEELTLAGLARDAVRLVQETRKGLGLDIADRIRLWWTSDRPDVAAALRRHRDLLADEVLAVEVAEGEGPTDPTSFADPAMTVWLARE